MQYCIGMYSTVDYSELEITEVFHSNIVGTKLQPIGNGFVQAFHTFSSVTVNC